MTATEKQSRALDVRAAAQNLKECIERSVPRSVARRKAIDKVRNARSIAVREIMRATA